MNRFALLFLLIAALLSGSPSVGQPAAFQRGSDGLSEVRRRWESYSEEERATLRARFERLQQMTPEQRAKLHERARRFRHLEEGLLEAPPAELEGALTEAKPHERRRILRDHLHHRVRGLGKRMRNKTPREWLEQLEQAAPDQRPFLVDRLRDQELKRQSRHGIEFLARRLKLEDAEVERVRNLPDSERIAWYLANKRRLLEERMSKHGPPFDLSAAAWERLRALSDRDFLGAIKMFRASCDPRPGSGDERDRPHRFRSDRKRLERESGGRPPRDGKRREGRSRKPAEEGSGRSA